MVSRTSGFLNYIIALYEEGNRTPLLEKEGWRDSQRADAPGWSNQTGFPSY